MKTNQTDITKITLLLVATTLLFGCGDDQKEAVKETEQAVSESIPAKPVPKVESDTTKMPDQRIEAPDSEPEQVETVKPSEDLLPPAETETTTAVATDQKAASDATEIVKPTPVEVRKIQQALLDAGFNPGPVDGIIGPKTLAALESFQKQKGLAVGQITKETLRALGIAQ